MSELLGPHGFQSSHDHGGASGHDHLDLSEEGRGDWNVFSAILMEDVACLNYSEEEGCGKPHEVFKEWEKRLEVRWLVWVIP